MSENLLDVRSLVTKFKSQDGTFTAVNGVSFCVKPGESVGIVGESGCGKSVTSMSIMRLLKAPPVTIEGEVFFEGKDLLKLNKKAMQDIRGNEIAMIFQEPMTSLNPVYTCGRQIAETFRLHQGLSKSEARKKTIEILDMVGIPLPHKRVDEYPHQLSGGMRQRVMIAMALACHPKLLIADEPTTALDVTIQAQIMELIKKLRGELGMALILITHDLGVVADVTDRVIVMYAGDVVEEAVVRAIYKNPLHPYTKGLLASIPKLSGERGELHVIEGVVPSPNEMPSGCRFAPRCTSCMACCLKAHPPLFEDGDGHRVRCWLYAQEGDQHE